MTAAKSHSAPRIEPPEGGAVLRRGRIKKKKDTTTCKRKKVAQKKRLFSPRVRRKTGEEWLGWLGIMFMY